MRRSLGLLLTTAATFFLVTAAARTEQGYRWHIPSWLPPPVVPADNPMSEAKVELGRRLFYDPRLSADGTMSCASCHEQARAFTDARPTPSGVTGDVHPRNAMSLANAGYLPVLTWANPLQTRLEQQALVPMFGESPVEMGMAGREQALFDRLHREPVYPPLFVRLFPSAKASSISARSRRPSPPSSAPSSPRARPMTATAMAANRMRSPPLRSAARRCSSASGWSASTAMAVCT